MGPRLRGDDRACCTRVRIHAQCVHAVCPIRLSKSPIVSQRSAAPCSCAGAGVRPYSVDFLALENEGSGAPQGATPENAPGCPGASRASGASADAPRALRRATRSFAFSAYTAVGPGGVLVRLRGNPEHRPRTWLAFATPAGTASRPTLMTPHEVRPSVDGHGRTIIRKNQKSIKKSPPVIFT